jgi:hypothetical protein
MTKQTPDEFGISYVRESFTEVAAKLREAAEYEDVMHTVLGWDSVEGMQSAIASSSVQGDLEAQGVSPYTTADGLLTYYGTRYDEMKREIADLTARNQQLSDQFTQAEQRKNTAEAEKTQALADAARQYQQDQARLNRQLQDMTRDRDSEHQKFVDAQAKYQAEVDARRTEVADLNREVGKWRTMYEDAVAPPGEREVLVAHGEVLNVDAENDFVIVKGGRDQGIAANERFVVYSVLPNGENLRKGMILIGKVNEHTSVATVTEESDDYILEGDLYVSVERWNHFNRDDLVAMGAGG